VFLHRNINNSELIKIKIKDKTKWMILQEVFEQESMDDIIDQWDPEREEIVKIAVLKEKYLARGEVSKWYESQKQKERLRISFDKDSKATVGLMHQWMDRALQTALYSAGGYSDSLKENDIWKMKMIIKKLLKGQDRATIYKDIANLLACRPDGKEGERERYFKEFAKCVEKLLQRDDMTEAQILHCIINSIFVHGSQKIQQLRDEVKKELIKAIWDDYHVLIVRWNEYCQTLDQMGWKENNDNDHIQANISRVSEVEVEDDSELMQIVSNKLYKIDREGKVESKDKKDMRTLLINALQRKFMGNCFNCWALNKHSAINCPILEKSICDDCSGQHHTNACGPISQLNKKKSTTYKKYKKDGSGKTTGGYPKSIKLANAMIKSKNDEGIQMCIANLLYNEDLQYSSDSNDDDQKQINVKMSKSFKYQCNNDSDEDESEDNTRGNYNGKDMNTTKYIGSNVLQLSGLIVNGNNKSNSLLKSESLDRINKYNCDLKTLDDDYVKNRINILNQIEDEKLHIRSLIPWEIKRNMTKLIMENVISTKVSNYHVICNSYNDRELSELIEMHEVNMTVNGDIEYMVENRINNITNDTGAWICNIDGDLTNDILNEILSYEIDPSKLVKRKNVIKEFSDINTKDRLKLKLSNFKSPVREKKWKVNTKVMSNYDCSNIHATDDSCCHNILNDIDEEFCIDCNNGTPISIEEQAEIDDEQDTKVMNEYYDWENNNNMKHCKEDYQSMRMSNTTKSNRGGRVHFDTPPSKSKWGTTHKPIHEIRQSNNVRYNHNKIHKNNSSYKAIKDDGVYKHIDGKVMMLMDADQSYVPVRTTEQLTQYFLLHQQI